jgi:hypothetical protein
MRTLLLTLGLSLIGTGTFACSCMGNNSYCETLGPDWFNPDATALVVKLSNYHYGISVKVVQVLGGAQLPDDTLMVWGDHGGLCRIPLTGIPVGDTIVFGLNATDFSGNTMVNPDYPPNLEQPGDYMVSGCGVYALNYHNGNVIGWVTAPAEQTMSLDEFIEVVADCSVNTGVEELDVDLVLVRYAAGIPQLEIPACEGQVQLDVRDAQGRVVLSRTWDGSVLPLVGFASGAYITEVRARNLRWIRKVVIG